MLFGYTAAAARPAVVAEQVQPLLGLLRSIGQRVTTSHSPWERTRLIFVNNTLSVARMTAGGAVLGLLPAIGTLGNGLLFGVVLGLGSRATAVPASPLALFLSIAPHGVFELPALWIGAAWGMKVGLAWLAPEAAGRRWLVWRASVMEAVVMLGLALAMLFVAAVVEGNVTLAVVRALRS